jgi:hypothetical protein
MWHREEVVLTDVSEERIASIIRVEGKIRKSARKASVRDVKSRLALAVFISNTSLLHSHRRENLKSYISVDCLENVGASTSHNPMGLHGLL